MSNQDYQPQGKGNQGQNFYRDNAYRGSNCRGYYDRNGDRIEMVIRDAKMGIVIAYIYHHIIVTLRIIVQRLRRSSIDC